MVLEALCKLFCQMIDVFNPVRLTRTSIRMRTSIQIILVRADRSYRRERPTIDSAAATIAAALSSAARLCKPEVLDSLGGAIGYQPISASAAAW
jgi:hypothetical protein